MDRMQVLTIVLLQPEKVKMKGPRNKMKGLKKRAYTIPNTSQAVLMTSLALMAPPYDAEFPRKEELSTFRDDPIKDTAPPRALSMNK